MCTYNGERFLGQQLESIAAQSVLPFELVVCDDQSNDGTIALLEAFSKTAPFAVRIYQNPARLKSTHNFQQGIALARGQLIALCDQDDLWKPEKLERLVGLMQDASLAGIFTDAELIDNEGRVLDGSLWDRGHFPLKEEAEFQRDPIGVLLKQDVATGATMIFRSAVRDLYHEIPQQWVHDGWLTWMMVLHSDELGRVAPSRERWMSYRVHQGQQTGEEAARVGSRSEPLAQRMEKARKLGHAHHRAAADRLALVLDHWLSNGAERDGSAAVRLRGAITLLEERGALPARSFRRILHVLRMLPAYMKYGRGLASAGRDLWA
jgi:hypothetical protein